jgi:hypothetical protein
MGKGKSRSGAELGLNDEQRQQAEAQLLQAAEDGRVQCASALAIARSLKVPSREIGRLADILDLRICQCQLNCF